MTLYAVRDLLARRALAGQPRPEAVSHVLRTALRFRGRNRKRGGRTTIDNRRTHRHNPGSSDPELLNTLGQTDPTRSGRPKRQRPMGLQTTDRRRIRRPERRTGDRDRLPRLGVEQYLRELADDEFAQLVAAVRLPDTHPQVQPHLATAHDNRPAQEGNQHQCPSTDTQTRSRRTSAAEPKGSKPAWNRTVNDVTADESLSGTGKARASSTANTPYSRANSTPSERRKRTLIAAKQSVPREITIQIPTAPTPTPTGSSPTATPNSERHACRTTSMPANSTTSPCFPKTRSWHGGYSPKLSPTAGPASSTTTPAATRVPAKISPTSTRSAATTAAGTMSVHDPVAGASSRASEADRVRGWTFRVFVTRCRGRAAPEVERGSGVPSGAHPPASSRHPPELDNRRRRRRTGREVGQTTCRSPPKPSGTEHANASPNASKQASRAASAGSPSTSTCPTPTRWSFIVDHSRHRPATAAPTTTTSCAQRTTVQPATQQRARRHRRPQLRRPRLTDSTQGGCPLAPRSDFSAEA